MGDFLYRTKGNAAPGGKPRVYFTCHPADLERFFDKICEDLFTVQDCTVYYTENMDCLIAGENRRTDLDRMNLFVIPVTFRLLSQPNRAMDSDFAYAREAHIPVLPLVMEPGLDALYSREDKFGALQYLEPYTTDETAIAYKEKLKNYLNSVLISDETAKRIRAAFDAYIFLSYRKKDRRYANELMRLIHSRPECRDIAIWFDEFLTPGESFTESIDRVLRDSKMVALLVTPNLLEKPNFIMDKEYPAAKQVGKTIFPAEMVPTDKQALQNSYEGIPECVDPHDKAAFFDRLLQSLQRVAVTVNDGDPEHTFLIGLAYLEGIDVETDKVRGVEMITAAAEAELPEAMERLYIMYRDGAGVPLDYRKAKQWCQKWAECLAKTLGQTHSDTLAAMGSLAIECSHIGDYMEAMELQERVCEFRSEQMGRRHPDTLTAMNNLAATCGILGDNKRVLKLLRKTAAIQRRVLGRNHPDTLSALNNLALGYSNLGNTRKALALQEKVYTIRCRVLGEDHPDTLKSLSNLALQYSHAGEHVQAFLLKEMVCFGLKETLGEEHPDTISAINNLAVTFNDLGRGEEAQKLHEKVYNLRCRILGESHPHTLMVLQDLVHIWEDLGEYHRALELSEKLYTLRKQTIGEKHPHTLLALNDQSRLSGRAGEYLKAAELGELAYQLHCEVLGEEHPDTILSLGNLALACSDLGQNERALALMEKAYRLHCKVLGQAHPATAAAAQFLKFLRSTAGKKA